VIAENMNPAYVTPLPDLGVLRIAGPDSRRFLQGQLSNDLEQLDARPGLRAGLHSPQGRVIAILQLFPAGEDVLAVTSRELVVPVVALLRRYLLRAKARVEDASDGHPVIGITDAGGRRVMVLPSGSPAPEGQPGNSRDWRAADIAEGLPRLTAATSGEFVAQMLNLDHIDGISFTKGCYTGQEIIARAHYRGRVKRRAQRFEIHSAGDLSPGQRIRLADGRDATVVDVLRMDEDRQECLAVAPLAAADATADGEATNVDSRPLPLPWATEAD
jgi:folate-binding protein YgfZ